jgi:hypothetical protein
MADLKSEQFGISQMSEAELLNHIKAVRLRRRERSKPKPRAASTKKKKDPISGLSDEQLKLLLEMAGK